jgi:hypothetical protein
MWLPRRVLQLKHRKRLPGFFWSQPQRHGMSFTFWVLEPATLAKRAT